MRMSTYCSQGQVASRGGLVGAGLSQGCRAAVAASPWLAGDAVRLFSACCGEWGACCAQGDTACRLRSVTGWGECGA